jgi:hypothetical protein
LADRSIPFLNSRMGEKKRAAQKNWNWFDNGSDGFEGSSRSWGYRTGEALGW